MPEGPSIVILREEASRFAGKQIIGVTGNTTIDLDRLQNQTVREFKSWGKHFLICFDDFMVRIHLLLFGSYRINEDKEAKIRLGLTFDNGFLNFYACQVRILEGKVNIHYDWTADVMNDQWSPRKAKSKLRKTPDMLICDALLEQDIFAGVGNIIKNEVLYRVKIHPESPAGRIPDKKVSEIIREARIYSFQFLDWKKQFILKKQWLAHAKKTCKRCDLPLVKKQTGLKRRRSFFCEKCQKLHS